MARCSASRISCACVFRFVACVILVMGSCAVLFSVLRTKHDVNDCLLMSDCLLFGDVSRHKTACRQRNQALPTGGPVGLCYFCVLWATVQLVLALIMAGLHSTQCCRKNKTRSKTYFMAELLFSSFSLLTCLITASLLTAGTEVFCTKLLHHWNDTYSAFPDANKPSDCAGAYILNDMSKADGAPYNFHEKLLVGQIGAWMCTVAWTAYVAMAAIACSRRESIETTSTTTSQRFTRLQDDS